MSLGAADKGTPAVKAYIGIGSNLGDRQAMLRRVVPELLDLEPGIRVLRQSTVLETKPVGPPDQPDYLNAVLLIETSLPPLDLLDRLLAIEDFLGRRRDKRWGPRTVDLDILVYGDQHIDIPRLKVPHPEIAHRTFLQDGLKELGWRSLNDG